MKPICINGYCFDRIHLWVQYHKSIPLFIEVVVEVFYPKHRQAEGLVMFNHGFLIGNDLLYYPKKILGAFLNDNPLFGINPSYYYNYSSAAADNNWAIAFISASHSQGTGLPAIDIGGNPRVGQEAYAVASYLIKYGATDLFYREDECGRNQLFFDCSLPGKSRFMTSNKVIFAGHSVGGAHAQAAACGFDELKKIGGKTGKPFNPIIYDREFLPVSSEPLSEWEPAHRASPVGLLQLSPVDQYFPLVAPGMQPYREALSVKPMPIVMAVGECDCPSLLSSTPPAWQENTDKPTQFKQLAPAGGNSWAVAARIAKGSHCGYLTEPDTLCQVSDSEKECNLCPGIAPYPPDGDESAFTTELFRRFIALNSKSNEGKGSRNEWLTSPFISWLNKQSPDGTVKLLPFRSGQYIDYAGAETMQKAQGAGIP